MKLDTTMEEAGLKDESAVSVVRVSDKIRVTVTSPDNTVQHYKLLR